MVTAWMPRPSGTPSAVKAAGERSTTGLSLGSAFLPLQPHSSTTQAMIVRPFRVFVIVTA
jgi:hypothetical protein